MWWLGLYFLLCVSNLLYCIQTDVLGIASCLMLYISTDSNKGPSKVLMQALARSWLAMLVFLSALTVSGLLCFLDMVDSECWTHDSLGDHHASAAFVLTTLTISGLAIPLGALAMFYANIVSGSLKRGGAALNAIADNDFVERWGEPKPILVEEFKLGLKPEEISCLPCMEASRCHAEASDCVICISPILAADNVRLLPNCGHAFHRPCVDQWLLRAGSCPLCKVKPTFPHAGQIGV